MFEIRSPKLYEININTEIKGDTTMDLNKFYNQIKMCLNEVNRIREELIPAYQSIKRNSQFEEYFIPDRNHPSNSWNVQIYNSLEHSLVVAITNDTCVKYCTAHQS